jgi:hypothetical protein
MRYSHLHAEERAPSKLTREILHLAVSSDGLDLRKADALAFEIAHVFACNWIWLVSLFYSSERAVRLGDAPTFNSVKRGVRPQGRSEVRFLTFPPIFRLDRETTVPQARGTATL